MDYIFGSMAIQTGQDLYFHIAPYFSKVYCF